MQARGVPALLHRNHGFALVVAVAVLIILVFSGVAVQRGVFEEVWDVRQAVGVTRARLAVTAGFEAALGQLEDFAARGESQRSFQGAIPGGGYQVSMRNITAAGLGDSLAWLPSSERLVEIAIMGVHRRGNEEFAVPGKETPPESIRQVTVVVDPRKVPYRVLLWVPE